MSDHTSAVPTKGNTADQDLGFTEEELFTELDSLFDAPLVIQSGDLTITMLTKRYGVCRETVRKKMEVLVESGKYIMLKRRLHGSIANVYRLKDSG
mgnify:CR=1 FL=1